MKPYTVIRDWSSDYWERCDALTDEPQVFHVWAKNACDANDEAEQLMGERFPEDHVDYLHPVAILHGHAPLVRDGE
ncbi:hypothetical protein [Streptomyces noursei]|uniref:hypothetical protein n=1 Tax=Streptomyces noursei TaxID=1971 RepID=UPI0016751340|nr:hypothetical protein [Streptomyces noursei]MCZ1015634.1 hypothetical protein [Streptomyces noursei]